MFKTLQLFINKLKAIEFIFLCLYVGRSNLVCNSDFQSYNTTTIVSLNSSSNTTTTYKSSIQTNTEPCWYATNSIDELQPFQILQASLFPGTKFSSLSLNRNSYRLCHDTKLISNKLYAYQFNIGINLCVVSTEVRVLIGSVVVGVFSKSNSTKDVFTAINGTFNSKGTTIAKLCIQSTQQIVQTSYCLTQDYAATYIDNVCLDLNTSINCVFNNIYNGSAVISQNNTSNDSTNSTNNTINNTNNNTTNITTNSTTNSTNNTNNSTNTTANSTNTTNNSTNITNTSNYINSTINNTNSSNITNINATNTSNIGNSLNSIIANTTNDTAANDTTISINNTTTDLIQASLDKSINQVLQSVGSTFVLTTMKFNPKFLISLVFFLDDMYYYRFHHNNYTQSARFFMQKIQLMNMVRLKCGLLNFLEELSKPILALAENVQYTHYMSINNTNDNTSTLQNSEISGTRNKYDMPNEVYFISSFESTFKQYLLLLVFCLLFLRLASLIFQFLSNQCSCFSSTLLKISISLKYRSSLFVLVSCLFLDNLADVCFSCAFQMQLMSRFAFINTLNFCICLIAFWSSVVCLSILSINILKHKRKSIQQVLIRSKPNSKGILTEGVCFMSRLLMRSFAHGILIKNYQLQICTLVFLDGLFLILLIRLRKGIMNRIIYIFLFFYYLLFLALDILFLVMNIIQPFNHFSLITADKVLFCIISALIALSLLISLSLLFKTIRQVYKIFCNKIRLIFGQLFNNKIASLKQMKSKRKIENISKTPQSKYNYPLKDLKNQKSQNINNKKLKSTRKDIAISIDQGQFKNKQEKKQIFPAKKQILIRSRKILQKRTQKQLKIALKRDGAKQNVIFLYKK